MRMEQTTHAPGQLRRILPGVLLAAGLVWLMTGLFAPLTLGLLLAALMAPMAETLSRTPAVPGGWLQWEPWRCSICCWGSP